MEKEIAKLLEDMVALTSLRKTRIRSDDCAVRDKDQIMVQQSPNEPLSERHFCVPKRACCVLTKPEAVHEIPVSTSSEMWCSCGRFQN